MVGSSQANLFASVSAGISALWGPLHGGANQAVINMLRMIQADGGDYQKYMDMAKDKNSGFRLMGFGHRVYKNFDPRATILKKAADDVLNELLLLRNGKLHVLQLIQRELLPSDNFHSQTLSFLRPQRSIQRLFSQSRTQPIKCLPRGISSGVRREVKQSVDGLRAPVEANGFQDLLVRPIAQPCKVLRKCGQRLPESKRCEVDLIGTTTNLCSKL